MAVLWPDACTSGTYGAFTGTAPSATQLVSMDCGVLMESVELALTTAGFQVVSWDAVRRRAVASELAPEQAAAMLGVQALIRILTLETSNHVSSVEFARTLHRADRNGNPMGGEIDPSRSQAANVFPQLEQGIAGVVRRSLTLIATVTLVPSGQVVWHFRNTTMEAVADGTLTRRAFIECGDEIGCVIRSAQSEGEAPTGTTVQGVDDPAAAAQYELLQESLTTFAAALRDGRLMHHCDAPDAACGAPLVDASVPGIGRGR